MKILKFYVDPFVHHQQAKLQANKHNIAFTSFWNSLRPSFFSVAGKKLVKAFTL